MTTVRFFTLTVILMLLAACGAASNTATIRTDGMRFIKEEVRVRAREAVTLRIVNRDGYAHSFDMDDFDIHKPLAAKEIAEIVIAPEGPGRYTFYCGTPGHQPAGMEGVLIVDP
ncbi:MAG: cupredoxin domain-containing protein [Chloroflexi bacterium]|nr:cupredoxin domain-containing protein [Chloroflexota bacterium]